jgi:hypothetical protein
MAFARTGRAANRRRDVQRASPTVNGRSRGRVLFREANAAVRCRLSPVRALPASNRASDHERVEQGAKLGGEPNARALRDPALPLNLRTVKPSRGATR